MKVISRIIALTSVENKTVFDPKISYLYQIVWNVQVQQSLGAAEGVGEHSDSAATAFLTPAVLQNMEFCICARHWNSRNMMLPVLRVFKGTQKQFSYRCKMLTGRLCGKHTTSSHAE